MAHALSHEFVTPALLEALGLPNGRVLGITLTARSSAPVLLEVEMEVPGDAMEPLQTQIKRYRLVEEE